MKITVLNQGDGFTLGGSYERGFRSWGHDVTRIDPGDVLDQQPGWRLRPLRRLFEKPLIHLAAGRLLEAVSATEPELVFVGKGAWALPDFWESLREKLPQTRLVCFNGDDPITTFSRGGNRPWVTASIPCFDLFLTYKEALVQPLSDAGARRVLRVPFAWDPEVHPAPEGSWEPPARPHPRIVFVGNGDAFRARWISDIVAAAPSGWQFEIHGDWRRPTSPSISDALSGESPTGPRMAEVIREADFALNILREQNLGSHNMRTFEVPGAGGVSLSQRSPEQEAIFPEGEAALYFESPREAVDVIGEIHASPARHREIRTGAGSRARDQTYRARARSVLDAIADC